ncbi:hypothetical protein CGCA056_v006159 [Colletotrichum aenigma]|uniref:uncharacterized protein n=1 Tax=Colletotrichum aenigma TaxID=1215731 RepID=UPI00187281ED|nr:uncharacterized protein CGCA056_v006159 [Colletotrichum aenigma]KAF5521145.1 hypothetical protein CGCA056_v006159 [Colletotrichum aenigma]
MTITTPSNNGQLARWLNRKGDVCFEVAFFATAAIFFVALGAAIIALSLVVGGLFVAGVILFGAADTTSEKVNKVASPEQIQAQTKEMMKEKGTEKQESAVEQDDVQKKDDAAQENDDDTQNKDGPKKNILKKKQQETAQTKSTGLRKLRPISDWDRILCQEVERKMDCTRRKSNIDKGGTSESASRLGTFVSSSTNHKLTQR